MSTKRMDLESLSQEHFVNVWPLKYDGAWYSDKKGKITVLEDDRFQKETENNSWSFEIEEIHEEPTRDGWIDVYERKRVISSVSRIIGSGRNSIVEFGSSAGYMIEEMRNLFPENQYIATDLMSEGLERSYARNKDILHIRCDFTDAPFKNETVDFVFSLNVLEHIEEDVRTISECYRILKPGGYCLFVVPRGDKLYDYFDEMLFHKRRYAKGELRHKCEAAGFQVEDNFHFAWLCYPAFWAKKKWNRYFLRGGVKRSREEKIKRVKKDVNGAMESPFAIGLMRVEHAVSKIFHPQYGIREFILCRKEE